MKISINFIVATISFITMLGCTEVVNKETKLIKTIIEKSPQEQKIEILKSLKKGDSINYLDLSYLDLTEIPNLSDFKINEVNLSYNKINEFDVEKLPREIKKLNMRSNNLSKKIIYKDSIFSYLKEIDLSYNRFKSIPLGCEPERINVSFNDLRYISFSHKNIKHLNISNNPNFSNVVDFDPLKIDTIIRDNIANNKPLIAIWRNRPKVNKGHQIRLTKEQIKELESKKTK